MHYNSEGLERPFLQIHLAILYGACSLNCPVCGESGILQLIMEAEREKKKKKHVRNEDKENLKKNIMFRYC